MEISPKITAAIDRFFPEAERPLVAALLAGYGDVAHEREAERIHLLVLKISRRDVNRVRDLVKAAKRDYRDVILWASRPSRRYVAGQLRNDRTPCLATGRPLKLSSLEKWTPRRFCSGLKLRGPLVAAPIAKRRRKPLQL
jgi:hypothetical protein